MSTRAPRITIMVHRDGDLSSKSLRVPLWAFRAAMIGGASLLGLLLVAAALYLPTVRAAASVPGLRRDLDRLREDNRQVRELVAALDTAERRYAQLRTMIGADVVPDPVALISPLPVAPTVRAVPPEAPVRFGVGPSVPRYWPLDDPGYLTRGRVVSGGRDEAHPGIDIAVPTGTIVRASGGGTVLESGSDREYGLFVLILHPEGYQSRYGHLSRVLAREGTRVQPGEVIGLSGNTGRSSAPHLHFELLRDGETVDPLTMVKERR